MADPRKLTEDQLEAQRRIVNAPRQSDAVQAAHGRIDDHMAALEAELAAEKQAREEAEAGLHDCQMTLDAAQRHIKTAGVERDRLVCEVVQALAIPMVGSVDLQAPAAKEPDHA